jgi:hypothetical protein
MAILILYAKVILSDGSLATGPVTTQDYQEFLFKNTGSSLDLYFGLKKYDGGWALSGGMNVPPSYIEQVGQQVDQELVMR